MEFFSSRYLWLQNILTIEIGKEFCFLNHLVQVVMEFMNLVLTLLWRSTAFSSPITIALKMINFVNMQYLSFMLCWKNSLWFFFITKTFFSFNFLNLWLQLLEPLTWISTMKENTNPFFLGLIYIYFFSYLTWIVISLFIFIFDWNCYSFISFHFCFLLFLLYFCIFSSLSQSLIIVQIVCRYKNLVHLIEYT